MNISEEFELMSHADNFDRATVVYNIVDEVISRMENALKDFRADYFQEYNDAKQAYYAAQEK